MTIGQVMKLAGRDYSYRAVADRDSQSSAPVPLIVALHGGTYTSAYFDVPGHSLIARAAAVGVPLVAIDRPGYGGTPLLGSEEASQSANAELLDAAIGELFGTVGRGTSGIVLVGHSIGGAIALRIAARRPAWPLLGVAVSGIGLRIAPGGAGVRAQLPDTAYVSMPTPVKDRQMFGATGAFAPAVRGASHAADAAAPRRELSDISTTWPAEAVAVLGSVTVPLNYRQGAQDALWVVDGAEVAAFAAAASSAPWVDAGVVANCGHCIDLHRAGASFQLEQLAFASRCALSNGLEA